MKVLIIEDNQDLALGLVRFLALKNIRAQVETDGIEGCYQALTKNYDALILDINLPGKDGLEICRELREKAKTLPIIMLTSRSQNSDIVTGLDIGADDYLVKPFDYEVLTARLHALTRRDLKNKSTTQIGFGPYVIDLEKNELLHNNELIHLSHLEFELLSYFAKNIGKIISKQELAEKVWGEFREDFVEGKTVDVYIGYLRKKLDKDLIQTKKGKGYMLQNIL
ncbi:response regulator transcription factor [Candidatus Gracilibacteria bacterium]|nr:response regulator transcription factor [Candidatus Gracilibacteria bacterium]